ncbi:saccharopine dehydrogenase NADP-binding domain-containing protein [Burkholderia cenocepacia]|uniref:saccharopine dehydrogenase C-terminal domain-containing protein n=1 Tax=Burkholderia cenocepacia TaxID=95486 RepID=UPI001B968F28|nr:saccharopine dehydrogenase C-terminal domain-containing protein [Burkholderia cenocepacia]MBR8094710.1 saccharopine dehydrogenase NADP-binding domain-containing protein [Burkholderia cenocepacia]
MKTMSNRIVMVGFGNIGQALLPLLSTHFPEYDVHIFEASVGQSQRDVCRRYHAHLTEQRITKENYGAVLQPLLSSRDYLLNLATSVSTCDLIGLAQSSGAFYLDTCIEPWEYPQADSGIAITNYALREEVCELRRQSGGRSTAVVAHGANPGFVSILLKKGLVDMAKVHGIAHGPCLCSDDWARLARRLDVRVIQISERDTQVSALARRPGEFVNTWSVDGLVTECLQPAELGWGTHEVKLPPNARRHQYGSQAAIYLDRPSHTVKVKSWSPNFLDFDAYLITHNEAISIADYLTLREAGVPVYRPTAYYAYHPCDEAIDSMRLLADNTTAAIESTRILKDEIVSGIDELGVFLLSGTYPSLWIGSNLSIGKARKLADQNNATSLQVVAGAVAAMAWMREHPNEGVLESDDLDYQFVFDYAEPYWSPIVAQYTDWRPTATGQSLQFEDFLIDGSIDKHNEQESSFSDIVEA